MLAWSHLGRHLREVQLGHMEDLVLDCQCINFKLVCKIAGFLMAFYVSLISFDPTLVLLVLPTPVLRLPGSTSASTLFPPSCHTCLRYYPPLPLFLKGFFFSPLAKSPKGLLWFILVCSEFSIGEAQIRTDAFMTRMCQRRAQILQCPPPSCLLATWPANLSAFICCTVSST